MNCKANKRGIFKLVDYPKGQPGPPPPPPPAPEPRPSVEKRLTTLEEKVDQILTIVEELKIRLWADTL